MFACLSFKAVWQRLPLSGKLSDHMCAGITFNVVVGKEGYYLSNRYFGNLVFRKEADSSQTIFIKIVH